MTFANAEEGLEEIAQSKTVIHIQDHAIHAAFKKKPALSRGVKIFGKHSVNFGNMIMSKNSALTPVLHWGITKATEKGIVEKVLKECCSLPATTVEVYEVGKYLSNFNDSIIIRDFKCMLAKALLPNRSLPSDKPF